MAQRDLMAKIRVRQKRAMSILVQVSVLGEAAVALAAEVEAEVSNANNYLYKENKKWRR